MFGTVGAVAQAGGEVSANSGRWLKLTEESAAKIKSLGGLTPTKTPGISHAMIGKPGASKSWIQAVQGPGSSLTNPAVLSNVGAMMTQMAMQQAIDEIKDYLAAIDEKVDDVLRAQKEGKRPPHSREGDELPKSVRRSSYPSAVVRAQPVSAGADVGSRL